MKFFTMLLVAGTIIASCSKSNGETTPEQDNGKGYVTGRLFDAKGNPVEGVEVTASHHTWYNTTSSAVTDANGNYKLSVSSPKGSWNISAQVVKVYNGKTYRFTVNPDNVVVTHEGGVRNMSWRLTGPMPGAPGDVKVGGYITYMDDNGEYIPESEIEFTLVPQGPLVDGSAGPTIITSAIHFPETFTGMFSSSGLRDVPVGRYKISARHIAPDGSIRKLLLSVRYSGIFAETVTADFEQEAAYTWQEIALFTRVKD